MKKKIVAIVFNILSVILILITTNINWGPNDWKGALEADAKGYYAYLPAAFIYQDFNFGFSEEIEAKYGQKHLNYNYKFDLNGSYINKYYCGAALAQTPFFLIAHFVTQFDDTQNADGYSKWYMLSVSIAAIFYHLLGLWFLIRILRLYQIQEKVIALIVIVCSLGTNLYIYTIAEAGMSHVYSFAFISFFLFAAKSLALNKKSYYLPILFLCLGIAILIRPINGLIVFTLPFIAGDFDVFRATIVRSVKDFKGIGIAILLFAIPVSLQLLYYKQATDHWWVYSYGKETFDFANPHIFDILLSYKKGLFLYTPIYFIGLLCAILLFRKSKFESISWFLFFALITYVFSSWWMWYYGGSFSSRVYVEYLTFFMIPIAVVANKLRSKQIRISFAAFLFAFTLLCQIQSYQYRYYDIHYSEMTEEKYWEVFLLRNRFN